MKMWKSSSFKCNSLEVFIPSPGVIKHLFIVVKSKMLHEVKNLKTHQILLLYLIDVEYSGKIEKKVTYKLGMFTLTRIQMSV